ncbi:hypothetical protein ACQJBY_004632 [Aegilops geniculata]
MVSTSLRRFLLGGIFFDFFCFGWTCLLLLPLLLGFNLDWPLSLATRVELAWTSWGGLDDTLPFDLGGSTPGRASWWAGRRLRGHPGVASTACCPSTSAAVHWCRALRSRWFVVSWLCRRTPVSLHELGYPTPFVHASDVPSRAIVLMPVFSSLGLVVVHC